MSLSDDDNQSAAARRHRAQKQLSAMAKMVDDLTTTWYIPPFEDLQYYDGFFIGVDVNALFPGLPDVLGPRRYTQILYQQFASQDELIEDYNELLGVTRTVFRLLEAGKFRVRVSVKQLQYTNITTRSLAVILFLDHAMLSVIRCPRLQERFERLTVPIADNIPRDMIPLIRNLDTTQYVDLLFESKKKDVIHSPSVRTTQSYLTRSLSRKPSRSEERS